MEYLNWTNIPQHILVEIFSYLHVNDRLNASLVCKAWSDCFHHPKLWSRFIFKFDSDVDNEGKAMTCVERYCDVLKDVKIYINQSQKVSRERACYVIDELTSLQKKKLQKFAFHFTGSNPLCFNGNEILDKLKNMFRHQAESELLLHLTSVDLNHCNIAFDNELFLIFAKHHNVLRVLRVQNSCLVDNVTPNSIHELVKKCPCLEELHTFYHCINSDVLETLAEKKSVPFRELSLMCNRSDKYNELIPSETWKTLSKAHPLCEVTMKFHSSMLHHKIIPLLCSGIPLVKLDLKIYGWLTDEIAHIGATFSSTLINLSFHTSLDWTRKAPPGLEPALLGLVSQCEKLRELHCYCALDIEVINSIKTLRNLDNFTLYAFGQNQDGRNP
ncbi:F-box/LRR-repeat protein 8-like [Clavelina lepadiformis]|uniref:F-box/LRR-repeat protein 8-like n=1 Tax=Clavelina lepadiformis TaxID=159417 RepID=UPI0040431F9E